MPLSRAERIADVGDRLAADLALVFQAQVTTHQAQDLDDADARRVDADVLQDQFRTLGDTGGNQEEGCRGYVGRDLDMGGAQLVPGFDLGGAALDHHRIAEAAQHALGVVAGRRRLGD